MSDPRLTVEKAFSRALGLAWTTDGNDLKAVVECHVHLTEALTAEIAALKADIIYMAREAGNAMPVDEMLNKLRTAREESDE